MFCRIYVNASNLNSKKLLSQLSESLQKVISNDLHSENEVSSITIKESEYYNKEMAFKFPDGFIFFPLNIEIDFYNSDENEASKIVNAVLDLLWKEGYSAIASCKFEELLTEKGGFKSKAIPWIKY